MSEPHLQRGPPDPEDLVGARGDELLDRIVERLPAPPAQRMSQLRALVFDCKYDDYRGVVVYIRVFDGKIRAGDKIRMMGTGRTFSVTDLGRNTPFPQKMKELGFAQVGYLCASIRSLADVSKFPCFDENHAIADRL
jgi:GTP-binding protein LepA